MQQYFAKNERLELEDSDYHHIKKRNENETW